jgi:ACS family sodium-dependent inorganic phosphate cotransporter
MGLDDSQQGLILSAFYYGYICMQVPSGYAAERWGGARVLLAGAAIWMLADLSTVPASPTLALIIMARVLMGAGEASNFPCLHSQAASWFPSQERSRMVAIMTR